MAPSSLQLATRKPASVWAARLALLSVLGISTVCTMVGCERKAASAPTTGDAVTGEKDASPESVTPPHVTDNAQNLLFSFVDVRGRIQAVGKVGDVPEKVKSRVLVVDLNKTPEERQAHRYAFFADLNTKSPDGSYPVTVVSRYNAAKGEGAATLLPDIPEGTVIVYSAVWCGYCKKAKAWMKKNDVPFVERDVEKTPGAQAELTQKMTAAGVPGGGIPVIDWGGELIVGFNQPRLEEKRKAQAAAPASPAAAGATP